MIKKSTFFICVFFTALLAGTEAAAQGLELRAGGGISAPARNHQSGNESGLLLLPGLRYRTADRHIAIGADFNFNYFNFESNPDLSYTTLGYVGAFEYYISEDEFHVYIGLSGGYFDIRQDKTMHCPERVTTL